MASNMAEMQERSLADRQGLPAASGAVKIRHDRPGWWVWLLASGCAGQPTEHLAAPMNREI
ncbi:uncharacterized protein BDCG_17836 [Blastomyces dermatitidis ER-3]|uniref:Uncharacterized protein n=3 Tax=Blastomyces TaxID=229219 RepID=A0A179V1I9_BLAGS|nr:uncharacterized protein BDBG_17985 [Blastomyces gilchristii SLH14081]XP_045282654.1 uncharacterized protein BDCG_17836 [Blastomyces dermatitidis ER-3]KMW68473.1 hypothetical protein BDDG_12844 [Blastomyces dermatitidis ATCC 18188]OAT02927.1 hypothetical protein BDCG_17836 [Blastomyces dermatitidis ER-3]OAT14216.1 hypothetical protein BDBG_17985 [Blastomyces gilchristii SLH14081]